MSLNNENMVMPVSPYYGNNGNCGMGGDWAWILLILLLCWNNGGFGYGNNGLQGALTRGDLCQDMNFGELKSGVVANGQDMQAGFRNVDNAVCQLGYNNSQLANGIQMQLANEFRGVDSAVCNLGYNMQNGFSQLANQLASCCCDEKQAINDVKTQSIMNTSAIQNQLQQCCCDNEKIAMQNRFDMQQYNCNTLQAIDKLGDRIVDYLNTQETQRLRDEVSMYRDRANSQYVINELSPKFPIPSFTVPNPFTAAAA